MPIDRTERTFETDIETYLLTHGGYVKGQAQYFDPEDALDKETLLKFIKTSQPRQWDRLVSIHGADAEQKFLQRVKQDISKRGILEVIRKDVKDYGVSIKLAYFAPANDLNPDTKDLYDQNILTITRQVRYSTKNNNSIDVLLSLNGLPLVTMELKNLATGQTAQHAVKQYKNDRDPKELLFQFKKRALVHFAVDPNIVFMATRLAGSKTFFLPFNKGNNNGAGNPTNPDGYRTAYLWEDILVKDSFMDILARFIHLEQKKVKQGNTFVTKETIIFPRYHQLDVVRQLEQDAKTNGSGKNYLIQHSAGSGKSNSIAWLAHRLSNLHDRENKPVFNSTIVITDRRVLDQQLQNNIYQFEHKAGVVEKIDTNSNKLAEAIIAGKKIIITTLQKFNFILQKVKDIPERRYAIIIDEAHSSQTGKSATAVKEALAVYTTATDELERAQGWQAEQDAQEETAEDFINEQLQALGRQKHLSYFAFTATPKNKTLEMFGQKQPDGSYKPFHLYSMRQAIEEEFILDVLKNYTTYQTYYKIAKAIEDDPQVSKKKGQREIARFVSLHPHNLAQKTEVMIEHFRRKTRHKIDGLAKAMVVTSSRLHALRYKQAFDKYINENHYTDLKTLVAFSGAVEDGGVSFTEVDINKFKESELPEKFDTDEYQVLIVADKYQTGFDQPLLHTMYVDKKLTGIKAVQTLSRLNRTHPMKKDTFILDFVNDPEDIKKAFQEFYEVTKLEEGTDPNLLYDLQNKLEAYQIYLTSEVEAFCKIYFKPKEKQTANDLGRLYRHLDPAVDRYDTKPEEEKEEFKKTLTTFVRIYSFISQIAPFQDVELHKLHAFGDMLLRRLPKDQHTDYFKLDNEVDLQYYRLEKTAELYIELEKGQEAFVDPISHASTGKVVDEKEALSTIIEILNRKHGTDFTPEDQLFIDQIAADGSLDEELAEQARNNSFENFRLAGEKKLSKLFIKRINRNQSMVKKAFDDPEFQRSLFDLLLKEIYEKARKVVGLD